MTALEAYLAGDHHEAWEMLLAAGATVRDDPALQADAEAVATATMQRVRRVVEQLRDRLPVLGWRFDDPAAVLVDPEPQVAPALDAAEAVIGRLPLSLRAFATEVGDVSLLGEHEEWDVEYPDPLVVAAAPPLLLEEHAERVAMDWFAETGEERFPMPLAPDALHKADVSGGAAYAIWLPDGAADAPWTEDDLHPGPFVEYLRRALLDCAGLPGWRREPGRTPPPELLELAATLERF